MAAFEDFDQKLFETNLNSRNQQVKNQKNLRHYCYINFENWHNNSTFFFFDFLLIGTWNWDLSKILFVQKFLKAAIVAGRPLPPIYLHLILDIL